MSFSDWYQSVVSCDSVGLVMACSWSSQRLHRKMPHLRRVIFTTELLQTASDDADHALIGSSASDGIKMEEKDATSTPSAGIKTEKDATSTPSADSKPSRIVFKDFYLESKWKYDKPLSFPKDMPSDTVIGSRYAALHRLAWNPNLGSHQWLAVAGNAGLLRILCVRNVGSHHAATYCANQLKAQSTVGGR